ncbi:cbb3-type cytochrome c oxidase subunit 3 [Rubellimicrobium sp. CFH 75288]|uniref:cbb3-type cytochrome c oxidase subunit 3 n=1 Tax=Rubellimicrobium sp. CFH 75288 TaxID=2697034 RepID=UPI001412909F|nr:cbb3-type cytochrome c oxidase subunit 3 [Rubellimicrobium sp. CFH 75288]NAZ36732.1 CcoQ/FixQ family Cbb3-type cytochrome c oxidase assembly chaperone [Rubellimicrobium sp. CFH 75288]
METYTLLRHFADSWALLALVLFFAASIAWVWRPGSRRLHDEAGGIPFRHEDHPPSGPAPARPRDPAPPSETRP